MRKLLFLLGYLALASATFSQATAPGDSVPAYIRTGIISDFVSYKAPDSTLYTKSNMGKGKPVLLMIYSPDCGHCQVVVKDIIKNIDHFSKTKILMVTWLPYSDMLSFYKNYKIADYPQITMVWDAKYFFPPYYFLQSFPKLLIYDKKGRYVKEFQGDVKIEEVWKAMGKK